jgi:ABC-2 type transport system permease protein
MHRTTAGTEDEQDADLGRGTSVGQLPAQVEIMVAMAAFGAMWGALSATAPRLARDRESGWLRSLEVTPLAAGRVLAARIVAGVMVALPAIVAVAVTAVLAHHVRLEAWEWAAGLGLLWAGTLPFVALGIVIGSLTNSTTAYALTTALYFALAALGGLWVPPAQFPPAMGGDASLFHYRAPSRPGHDEVRARRGTTARSGSPARCL